MSVAAPQHEAADAEALQRAQRAHEPSMEEILASIRAIIADERDPAPVKPGPQLVYASDAPGRAPIADPLDEPLGAVGPSPDDEGLLSDEATFAISGSFRALSESMAEHGRKAAEEMAREMLRPMLKAWLDANLPAMVERLVRSEIQRLARTSR